MCTCRISAFFKDNEEAIINKKHNMYLNDLRKAGLKAVKYSITLILKNIIVSRELF